MLNGHGDDLFMYDDIRINFSSNIYNHFDHEGLFCHLRGLFHTLRNYPEPTPATLEHQLAAHLSLAPTEVMVTSGATEAIYLIAQAFAGVETVIHTPAFSEYEDACRMHGHHLHFWQAGTDARLPDGGLVFLCCPNNPTGQVFSREDLERLIASAPSCVFVIDASYAPYTTLPLLSVSEAARLGNVLLIHSMTKEYGVPGLRLGYITACASLLDRLRRCRMPWTVSSLAIEAGKYLVANADHYLIDAHALCAERERVAQELCAGGRISALPSDTHILLCRLTDAELTASQLKERLARNHGILIRDASNFRGLDEGFFRIAVQSPLENDALVAAITHETT